MARTAGAPRVVSLLALASSALVFVTALVACESEEHGKPARPNVLLIVLDTTRVDFLSAYGFAQPTTPNIDELAKTAVRYDRAYSTGNWTVPSHASLLTGLYPSEVAANWNTPRLREGVTTLAEILRGAGYATRAAAGNPWISTEGGFDQGFDVFTEAWKQPVKPGTTVVVEEPLEWIREFEASERPFLIFLNFNRVHLPNAPSSPHAEKFLGEGYSRYDVKRLSQIRGDLFGQLLLQPDEFQIMRELYAGEVHTVDMYVGRLIDELRKTRLLDETLIIIVADHGEHIGESGRLGHSLSMAEQTVHIPLIVRFPSSFPPGTVDGSLVSLVDIVPTVLDVTGIEAPESATALAGRSLAGDPRGSRPFVVVEDERPLPQLVDFEINYPMLDRDVYDHPTRTIVTHRYKLIWNGNQPLELYDLRSDPAEQYNLREGLPEVEERLLRYLKDWSEATRSEPIDDAYAPQDPATIENLRALGYIE